MKYGFIGCGNMGSSLARALATVTKDIAITDRSGKAKTLAAELGFTYTDTATIASNCDRIFLGVKPQMMADCLAPIQSILIAKKPLLITMAAGLTTEKIAQMAGGSLPIIRIMPNTPTAVGKGMIPYCYNNLVEEPVLADWLSDMTPCGRLDALQEDQINAASALSGSGPAYFYLMLEALTDGAAACGLPREKALDYAALTMEGAARMLLDTSADPAALRKAVCSPGGSTLAGIGILLERDFPSAVKDCVLAAYKRNLELGG